MTQLDLLDRPSVNLDALCPQARKVAEYFLARPGQWVSMQELSRVGGTGGWRTRVSECRRIAGLPISKPRQYMQDGYRHSGYRYVPEAGR